ncbi:MAG: hypothetical protein IJY64_04045 [Bacteroidaceae bacterium]|nr:hypothetical protein [Bacteroidaceae bacterium]
MKKIIIALLALLTMSAPIVNAQEADTLAIKAFLKKLKKLESNSISYEVITGEKLQNMLVEQLNEQTVNALGNFKGKNLFGKEFTMINISSEDEEGYNKVRTLLEQYDAYESEELFGIPLTANNREDGSESVVYMSENHSILINDEFDEESIEVLYCNYNLMNILKTILVGFTEEINVSLSLFNNGNITFNGKKAEAPTPQPVKAVGCNAPQILAAVSESYDNMIKQLEERTQDEETQEQIEELKKEKTESLEELENTLATMDIPSFIENPLTEEVYIAVPILSTELAALQSPQAKNGIYDWIASTGFCKGAENNFDQKSDIITPDDVLMKYAIEYLPKEQWLFDGYTTCKEEFITKYQGGTPAVLYRKSETPKGYNDMLADLKPLFDLEFEGIYNNLEVTQKSQRETSGNRFLRLYGEGDISIYLLDCPKEKLCLMAIVIGQSDFKKAVNDYRVGGEKNIADRYNIIISENGIRFTTEEYFFSPKKHKNGLHIDFGLAHKFILNE